MYGGVKWVILTWFVSSTLFMILSMRSVSQWVSKLFGCNGIMHSCSPDGPHKQERQQFNSILWDNGPTERRCRNKSRPSDKTQWENMKKKRRIFYFYICIFFFSLHSDVLHLRILFYVIYTEHISDVTIQCNTHWYFFFFNVLGRV